MNVLLFGDQTADQTSLLRKVVNRKENALLQTFLDQVSVALREETRKLPKIIRSTIPDFLTVKHLLEAYIEKGTKVPQLESCLVVIAQLSHFIGYYSEHPTELPNAANTRIIGLCTGLLAGAAIASSRSLTELIALGIEVVKIAFRTGSTTGTAKYALEHSTNNRESWSTIVTGTSEQSAKDALDRFHKENSIPATSQAYVSAVSVMAVTISGPPSTLKRVFSECDALKKNHRVQIPVYAPYHAAHLYSEADIERILDEESREVLKQFRPAALMHSATTGRCHAASNSLELVEIALSEILQLPVRWNSLLEECVSQMTANGKSGCTVTAIGTTNVANSLVSALKAGGLVSVTVKDQSSWVAPADGVLGRTQNDKIAIVGMAGRFPSAASHEALWDLLMKGLDVHREIPSDRFDAQAHCDPSGKGKNKSHTPYGCFIDEPGLFDPRFFNMSPREAAQTDPMGRLALVTAYEALEMSGYVPNRTPSTKLDRIGTFYGQTSDDWREINAAENVDTYFITGGVRAFAPGRINYYFKFSGPSYSVDTACSSSLAAIQLACTSLWAGDCDTACAGGLNVLTNPDIFSGLSKGQFLSKTGSCKTYDNNADGYCRGDGCGTVVLKRYEDAIADKDNILGCILGAATNHSAEAVSITHPHAGAQEFLYKRVLADAGVDAHDVSYVEMHGTGTQAGDGIEMTSVTNAFAPRNRQRRSEQTLHLGAVKANIGHGEAASGINSLIKVMMMFKKNAIPPNVGIKGQINQSFPKDLKDRNVHISTTTVDFPRHGAEKRKIFLNNFSAAGGNTAILLEDGPLSEAPKAIDPRSTLPVTVSARSIASLKRNIQRLQDFVKETPEATLSSLSYTTTARRIQHNYRVAFPLADISRVNESLQAQSKDSYSPVPMVPTKVAFTFTGQGSQYTALGQALYNDLKSFKADIDSLDNLARIQGLPSFIPLLDGTDVQTLSPVVVQLGMACIQVALARMWASWGVTPVAVIGHSLGEYAALHVAGVISASDMVLLVGRRAQLLVAECTPHTHGMLAVKGSVETISKVLGSRMTEIACINGPEETVLCGSGEVVEAAQETLGGQGFKATRLNVPFAFHSAQVKPILEPFKAVAGSVVYNKPQVPVLSPLTGEIIRDAGIIGPEYLARHARETVNFLTALTTGQKEKLVDDKTSWLEIGAHPVCSGMVKSSLGTTQTAPSLRRNEDPWKTIATSICTLYTAGAYIDFNEYHYEFNDTHELLPLPTYSFDEKKYWLDYHNNWTLTKGEAPKTIAAPAAPVAIEEPKSKLSTTSCQRIVREELHANSGTVVVRSNVAEPKLHAACIGHQVNQTPLCPSSLYMDMAMTVADYLYKELRPSGPEVGYNVCKMEVGKPFIAKVPAPAEGQFLELEATADLEQGCAFLKYRSVSPEGKTLLEHAHCTVKFEDKESWAEEWNRISFMAQSQIDQLEKKLHRGEADKFNRGMAYKLFKSFVDYGPKFRGMESVIIDGKLSEASANIQFQTTKEDGEWSCAPYWVDSICHLAGFICNASEAFDSENFAHISHGWGAMRIKKQLSPDKKYRNYVRMLDAPNNVSVGSIYIFEGDEVVAVCDSLKFQQIPRRLLNTFLPPPKKAGQTAAAPPALAVPKAAPVKATAAKPVTVAPPKVSTKSAKPAKPAKKAAPKAVGSTITSRVMKIIAEETEVDMSELVDGAAFENLGVDSLLSLTISARFREDLDLEISSNLFTDFPDVGAMKSFFSQYDGGAPATDEEADSDSESEQSNEDLTPHEQEATTPASSVPSENGDVFESKSTPVAATGEVSIARQIVAQEMGIDLSEIVDQASLSEMGMDSLMSLTILGALREATNIDLPSEFLVTNDTIEDIENALGMRPKPKAKAEVKEVKAEKKQDKKQKEPELEKVNAKLMDISKFPPATSVLLQGNAKIATKKLFLFPDGSGSATSYISIPNISPSLAVYGLNCPFMKTPTQFTCGIEGVSAIYLAEMKRRQPQGPYIIGGWSAGGVVAYEVALQLQAMGEKVERLVLIDSPCPVALEPLPARLHHFFDSIGLLGTGKPGGTPGWLLPHFEYSIKALDQYEPTPMAKGQRVPTYAVWAREGVCGKPGDPRPPPAEGEDPKPMKWLLNNRTDFGDNGWGQLLGTENMTFATMDGNHFTMMRDEHGETLGGLLRSGLSLSS
ncbi:MAG: Type I Iterative PKS [Bathelium mastoideum]|nr:MAG: Type I Iterative PKS [Bathelium mastoideum]